MSYKMKCPVCEERSTYPEGAIDCDIECYLCHDTGEVAYVETGSCPFCGCPETYIKADIVPDNERMTIVAFMGIYCPGCQTTLGTMECQPRAAAEIYNNRAEAKE